mmetsp:Transcript_53564/g.116778  ORF Transcript_53564/g.116778 Transcript_53564/m.116778 type:complete len:210 (+) Transcript_53564:1178-1807(+)
MHRTQKVVARRSVWPLPRRASPPRRRRGEHAVLGAGARRRALAQGAQHVGRRRVCLLRQARRRDGHCAGPAAGAVGRGLRPLQKRAAQGDRRPRVEARHQRDAGARARLQRAAQRWVRQHLVVPGQLERRLARRICERRVRGRAESAVRPRARRARRDVGRDRRRERPRTDGLAAPRRRRREALVRRGAHARRERAARRTEAAALQMLA